MKIQKVKCFLTLIPKVTHIIQQFNTRIPNHVNLADSITHKKEAYFMQINHLQTTIYNKTIYEKKATQQNQDVSVSKNQSISKNQDVFEKSNDTVVEEAITYAPPKKLTEKQVDELKNQMKQSMIDLAKKMLNEQVSIANDKDFEQLAKKLGIGTTPEAAAEAISENGQWGVDAVSTRLMDMVITLSGGDVEKAGILREAIQKGFAEVGALDSLPQVCQDTYHETMKRLDYWEEHGSMDGYEK